MMTFRAERKDDFQDSGEETDFPPAKRRKQDRPRARRHKKSTKERSRCDNEDESSNQ